MACLFQHILLPRCDQPVADHRTNSPDKTPTRKQSVLVGPHWRRTTIKSHQNPGDQTRTRRVVWDGTVGAAGRTHRHTVGARVASSSPTPWSPTREPRGAGAARPSLLHFPSHFYPQGSNTNLSAPRVLAPKKGKGSVPRDAQAGPRTSL